MLCQFTRSPAVLLLLAYGAVLLQLLPQATAATPPLELSKWNRAYKLTVNNIDSKLKDQYNLIAQPCVKDVGFGSDAAAAPLDACHYHQEKNGTYTKWVKKAGEWRMNTNCYCYALDVYRDGFCIPGRSSSAVTDALMSGQEKTCELMTSAVLADGARPVTRAQALSAVAPPAGSHYIGLLVRKRSCIPTHCWQNDFHLVRKDDNGKWSWKEPGGPASALDINNQPVSDPEAAATGGLLPGHYRIWCGFFMVNPSTMKVGGNFDQPYSLQGQAAFLKRLPGIAVALQELPYNHSVDGAPDRFTQELIEQDAAWDAKRGTKEWNDFYAQLNASQSGGFDEHFAQQREGMFNRQQQQPPSGMYPNNAGVVDDRQDPEYELDNGEAGSTGPGSSSSSSSAAQGPVETPGEVLAEDSSVRNASSTAAAAAASASSSTGRTPPSVTPLAMRAGAPAAQTAAVSQSAAVTAPAAKAAPAVQGIKVKPPAQPVPMHEPATTIKPATPASTPKADITAAKPASPKPASAAAGHLYATEPARTNHAPAATAHAAPTAVRAPAVVAKATAASSNVAHVSSRSNPEPQIASGPAEGALGRTPSHSVRGGNGRRLLSSFA